MSTPDVTLIGLAAAAGSGKDTAADHLCARYGFVRASFAEAPRVMLEALLSHIGVDHAWLHEPRLKESPMPVLEHSYRTLMQTLGTEWGRNMVGHGLWVRVGGQPVAEVALVVADDYQGQGIGTTLADALVADLSGRGVERVEVFASASNKPVARMVARRAPDALRERDGATVTYEFAAAPVPGVVRTVA